MKKIQLTSGLDDAWLKSQEGRYFDDRHFDRVVTGEPTDVFKPDGSPLLLYRPRALPAELRDRARPALRRVGMTKGEHRDYHSGIFGYFHKPTCRKTAFSLRQLDLYGAALAFARACDGIFRAELPDRYAAQRARAVEAPEWALGATAFSTGTANLWTARHDARTPLHVDRGDLREGFGVLAALRKGTYRGGELIFPKYGIAVDLHDGDVLLADVHDYHANNAIAGEPGWERIAVILYLLTAMRDCVATVD